jgi:hypothetical protein
MKRYVLPGGLFAENETGVSLALINFGVHMETLPFKKYDPVIAFQTFGFLVEGDFWKVKMIIDYDLTRSGQPFPFDRSDVLDISGFVQHIFTPHSGDSDIGPELPYFVVISAVEEFPSEPGIARGGQILAGAHPSVGHNDFGVALLSGKIMANASRREFDFESWVGGVIVRHTIPQPSTAVLFGSGLLAFAGMAWTRCRRTRPSS